jgi:hypothetical protein
MKPYRFGRFFGFINTNPTRIIAALTMAVIGLSVMPPHTATTHRLEYLQHCCNWTELVAVGLVVVGVLLEKDSFPDRIKAFGWDILMIGLVLEFLIGFDLLQLNSNIEARSKYEIGQLYLKAKNADDDAAKATDDAAKANEETAKANIKIAILRQASEPRSLNGDEFWDFNQTLNAFKGQKFTILMVAPDEERYGFAINIRSALWSAQWDNGEASPGVSNFWTVGVTVVVNQNEPTSSQTWLAADTLAKLLYKYKFSTISVPQPRGNDAAVGVVAVIVADKIPISMEDNGN